MIEFVRRLVGGTTERCGNRVQIENGAGVLAGPLTNAELRATAVPVSAAQLPAAVGQTTMAASLGVAIASNQGAVPGSVADGAVERSARR